MDILIAPLAILLLAIQLLNLATFNHQPDKVRLVIDGLSVLGYGGLVGMALFYARPATLVHLAGLILFTVAGLISFGAHSERASLSSFVEHVTGPMLLGILTMRRVPALGSQSAWLLWSVAAAAAILAAGLALLGPPVTLADVQRLAIFAGGESGVHPSAYASACMFLTLLVLLRGKVGLSWITVLILVILAYVIFKYQVRTVWLMLATLAAFAALYWLAQRSMGLVVAGMGAAILGVAAILLVLSSTGFDLAHFSSGRTLIYAERLQVISARGPLELLFGTGGGTDKFRGVSAWRWDEKDSHNDLLIVTVELGLVGLVGFLLMIVAPLAALPSSRKSWIIMIAASSLVSNGVLLRPSIGPPFILAAWLSLALRERYFGNAATEDLEPDYERKARAGPLAGADAGRVWRRSVTSLSERR